MPDLEINWLVCIVVSRPQSRKLMAKLTEKDFYFTIIDSNSSLFYEPSLCLILGLNESRITELDRLVEKYCQPYKKYVPLPIHGTAELSYMPVLESHKGGATLFGVSVEYFEQV